MTLKTLVVDDSVLYRRIISDALAEIPGVEVAGTANSGKVALDRIAALKPDLVTLDAEMPGISGLDVLQSIHDRGLDVGTIMVASPGRRSREQTVRALELGAFDFLLKPDGGSVEASKERIERGLTAIIKAYANRREIRLILRGGPAPPAGEPSARAPQPNRHPGRRPVG